MTNYKQLFKDFCVENQISDADNNLRHKIKNLPISETILKKVAPGGDLQEGQKLDLMGLILKQKFTQPPGRYSAASLVRKMEELGIGRPSTYASIISTLQDRQYVDGGNSMKPTTLGRQVNMILKENFEEVTSSEMTATMEDNLDKISMGEAGYEKVLGDFWYRFKDEVETKSKKLSLEKEKYRSLETDVRCPTCDSEMELKSGRFGEYFQCKTHHEHQFPKNFREYAIALEQARIQYQSEAIGKKCEVCGQDLIVRVSKSSLKPYIACPEYRVGNKHTVVSIGGQSKSKPTGKKRFIKKRNK